LRGPDIADCYTAGNLLDRPHIDPLFLSPFPIRLRTRGFFKSSVSRFFASSNACAFTTLFSSEKNAINLRLNPTQPEMSLKCCRYIRSRNRWSALDFAHPGPNGGQWDRVSVFACEAVRRMPFASAGPLILPFPSHRRSSPLESSTCRPAPVETVFAHGNRPNVALAEWKAQLFPAFRMPQTPKRAGREFKGRRRRRRSEHALDAAERSAEWGRKRHRSDPFSVDFGPPTTSAGKRRKP